MLPLMMNKATTSAFATAPSLRGSVAACLPLARDEESTLETGLHQVVCVIDPRAVSSAVEHCAYNAIFTSL
ncbi:MAG: hypothetical protein QOG21_2260 [Actinomycetota bacterium]|nr:hypothetical protein [Actinomycetota bacterium]